MQKVEIPIKTGNTQYKCLEIKTKSTMFKKRYVKTWTAEQDQRLVALYNEYPKKWNLISEKMKNRNENQCLHRFRRICMLGQNKKIWSPEEDKIVLEIISKAGPNWKLIAHYLKTKTGKQIRQRFINKLDPNIRRQEWTEEQDLQIIELFTKMGSKWCQISKSLPGRPQNRIKNRFYSYIQKNYQFRIKDNSCAESNELENKQNSLMSVGIKPIEKRPSESLSMSKKSSSLRILEQKMVNGCFQRSNSEVKSELKYDSEVKHESEVKYEEIKCGQMADYMKEQQNQIDYNSLKQINDEFFYKYTSAANNNDLLYFQDN